MPIPSTVRRPDFLDRCQPTQLPAGANPVAYGTFPDVSCTALPGSQLRDGRMSFPSGHASCSMVVGLFGALYLLWSVHLRAHRCAFLGGGGPHSMHAYELQLAAVAGGACQHTCCGCVGASHTQVACGYFVYCSQPDAWQRHDRV